MNAYPQELKSSQECFVKKIRKLKKKSLKATNSSESIKNIEIVDVNDNEHKTNSDNNRPTSLSNITIEDFSPHDFGAHETRCNDGEHNNHDEIGEFNRNNSELSSGSKDEISSLDEPSLILDPLLKIQNDKEEENLTLEFKKIDEVISSITEISKMKKSNLGNLFF